LPLATDLNITAQEIAGLVSVDAVAAFFQTLGYDTARRSGLTPQAIGLAGESASPIKSIEVLSEDAEGFLRVVFVQLRSLTAKSRNDLARVLGKTALDHLLVLTSNFDTLEFVLLHKRKEQRRGPGAVDRVQVVPLSITVDRRSPEKKELKALRRFTWTCRDALDQYDKLRTVFEASAFTEEYFQNRALFADHYLVERLRDDPAWRDNPSNVFLEMKDRLRDAARRWQGKGEQLVRDELYEPLFKLLGFDGKQNKAPGSSQTEPDYLLYSSPPLSKGGPGGVALQATDAQTHPLTAAFVYQWDRWLDGPDIHDEETPEENPGACVVSALETGAANWIIVTNGRHWRLYSGETHSRATNFYEVDLVEALTASGDTDPNEAFRYWWLFFRASAFHSDRRAGDVSPPVESSVTSPHQGAHAPRSPDTAQSAPSIQRTCWLDQIVAGSRDYAKRLGERLKERIFVTIFPHLAQGFLEDRRQRLGLKKHPTEEELRDLLEATLTLLYRLLFLLYAESRDLLPIREAPYRQASLKKIKEEIAEQGGTADSEVRDRLINAYSDKETALYDRLTRLFQAMDKGDPTLNVPTYNGGLFLTSPPTKRQDAASTSPPLRKGGPGGVTSPGSSASDSTTSASEPREQRIGRFLNDHKIPDRYLALAVDRLSRDEDEKTFSLVNIDYKSLEVRHLGSIYEGLLEFKLKIADEDLTTQTEDKKEKFIALTKAKPKRGKPVTAVVRKGEIFLSNDKSERKATGSYYTPDPIVEYIVEHTVGPVLKEKLEALRTEFRKVRRTFDREVEKATAYPVKKADGTTWDPREFAEEATYTAHKDLVETLFDFRVLDPAMGSGHFLVEGVDFITDRLLTFLNSFPTNPVSFALKRTRKNILEALTKQGVSVDPEKLTEINLLKRHVLKRCIYGVDLNPMAVELAKVSLWLDAFTLGAPLSFLDHHLRCGNSLIGATFKDLEATVKSTSKRAGSLFGINYEPLLRAIQHVLFVNKMADATAAEVKQSSSEYDRAREDLGGYQVVLDLLVAKHFGFPKAPELLTHAQEVDLRGRDRFLASLEDDKERDLVAQVERLASQPDRRFFHWEIEFPEIFFEPSGATGQFVQHKDEITAGSAGFDAVVGNPPYVRQETIKPLKAYLQENYETFDSTNDLYVYFQEREIRLLRADARMGMIVANKWMRAGYGVGIRGFLQRTACPLDLVDFGHSPIFPDADTFPCILIAGRRTKPIASQDVAGSGEVMHVCAVPRDDWDEHMNLLGYATTKRHSLPTNLLRDENWSIERPLLQGLMEKIRKSGVQLKDFIGSSPLYGIKTGLNDAFCLDAETRERLIREDSRSAEIIKPLVRGRDIGRWRARESNTFLIFARRGIDIEKYPAVKRHLSGFRAQLEPRPANWSGANWPGRASGSYEWYELQASPSNEAARTLEGPKILYQDLAWHSEFAVDTGGFIPNNTAYLIPGTDCYLLAILNSPLMWSYISRTAQHGKDEVLRMFTDFVETIPIAEPGKNDSVQRCSDIVPLSIEIADRRHQFEAECVTSFRERFDTQEADERLIDWLVIPPETFVERFSKLVTARRSSASSEELIRMQAAHRGREVELLKQQLKLEQRLATLVEDAYGLTPDERELLRATRPVRDPLEVLESRIRGKTIATGAETTDY